MTVNLGKNSASQPMQDVRAKLLDEVTTLTCRDGEKK